MANLEIIAKLKNLISPDAVKATTDVKGITQAVGEADVKMAAFTQRQRMLTSEMNKLAKEVATGKTSVEDATKKYEAFEKSLVKIETVAPQVTTSLDKMDEGAKKNQFSFTELNQALELVEKGIGIVVSVGKELYEIIGDGAKVQAAANTFTHLSESINATSESLLGGLRQATGSMVSDMDLMGGANRFVAMGLANTQEEAGKLANIATQLGVAFRGDAVSGMEELALLLANQSIPRLDSFGVSASKVRERIAELQAANAGMGRETAFMTAFMEQAQQTMGKIGPQGETAAAGLARLESAVKNISDQFKVALADGLAPAIDKIADESIPKLADSVENGLVPALVGAVEAVLPALTDAATGTIDRVTLMASAVNFNDVRSQLQDLGMSFSEINEVVGDGRAKLDLWRTSADLSRDLTATEEGIKRMELAIIGMNLGLSETGTITPTVANGFNTGQSELDKFVTLMEQFTSDVQPAATGMEYWNLATRDASVAVVETTQSLGLYRDALLQVQAAQAAATEAGKPFVYNVYEMGGAVLEMDQRMRAVNRVLVDHGVSLNATTVPADEYYYSTHEATEVTYEFDESLQAVQGSILPTTEAMAAYNARLGDYFVQATKADEGSQLFSQGIAGIAPNAQAVNQELYNMIAAGDGSAVSIAAAGIALGVFDDVAAEAYLKTAILQEKMKALSEAFAMDGNVQALTDGMNAAIEQVNGLSVSVNESTGKLVIMDTSVQNATTSTQGMIDKFGEIPGEITTEITNTALEAMGFTQQYIDRLNSIPSRKTTIVEVAGSDSAGAANGQGGNLPGLASGGRVNPMQAYLVGDAPGGGITPYTEMLIPDQPGFVVNNETLQRLMGGGASGSAGTTPYIPSAPMFGGGSEGGGGSPIQIINQFNVPVSQGMLGQIEAAQKQAISQALAERDRRVTGMRRMG